MRPVTCRRFARSRRLPHPRRRSRQRAQTLTATTTAARAGQSTSAPDAQHKRRAPSFVFPRLGGRPGGSQPSTRWMDETCHRVHPSPSLDRASFKPLRRAATSRAAHTSAVRRPADDDENTPTLIRKSAFPACECWLHAGLALGQTRRMRKTVEATDNARTRFLHIYRRGLCLPAQPIRVAGRARRYLKIQRSVHKQSDRVRRVLAAAHRAPCMILAIHCGGSHVSDRHSRCGGVRQSRGGQPRAHPTRYSARAHAGQAV